MITLNNDGYVRLTQATLQHVTLIHLWSGVDEDGALPIGRGEAIDAITGLSEWVSTETPAISIGWDWKLEAWQGAPEFIILGVPRTNVMLVDQQHNDLGADQTAALLVATVCGLDWQRELISYING